MLKVLWIAPEIPGMAPLAWIHELGEMSAIDGVEVRTVLGAEVRRAEVAQALRRPHDVVIWSGHGVPGGLLMPKGEPIKPHWLAQQVRSCPPRCVIVATCASVDVDQQLRSIAQEISRNGIHSVGFPAAAEDRAAVVYNIEFVRAMAAKADSLSAHEVALEAIEELETGRHIIFLPGYTNGLRDLYDRMERIEGTAENLLAGQLLIMKHLSIPAPAVGVQPCR